MRNFVRTILAGATATAAVGLASVPAQAVTVIGCGGGSSCLTGTINVNLVAADDVATGSFGLGNIGIGGSEVKFSSTSDILDLITGQATVKAGDDTLLNQLTFSVADGFTGAEFSLNPLTGGGGKPLTFSVLFTSMAGITGQSLFTTGDQRFAILAGAGETITQVNIASAEGFGTFRQLRIGQGAVGAVPEPATWMFMLLGMAGVGFSMRRKEKRLYAYVTPELIIEFQQSRRSKDRRFCFVYLSPLFYNSAQHHGVLTYWI